MGVFEFGCKDEEKEFLRPRSLCYPCNAGSVELPADAFILLLNAKKNVLCPWMTILLGFDKN